MKKLLTIFCLLPLSLLAQTPYGNGVYKVKLPNAASMDLGFKRAFLEDDSSHIWMGFGFHKLNQGTVGLGKLANGNWTMFNTSNSGILSNKITDLAEGDSSDILIGTHGGLSIFNQKNNTWADITEANSALPSDLVTCIARQGAITWIGTNAGLVKLEQGSMTVYNGNNWGVTSDSVGALLVSGSTLYVGTARGLAQFNGGSWTVHGYQNDLPVRRITKGIGSTLYLYTDSGLFSFTPPTGLYGYFPSQMECLQGLDHGKLKGGAGITSDPAGNVYFVPTSAPGINTWNGDLYLYKVKDEEVTEMRFFGIGASFNTRTFLASDEDGTIWIMDGRMDSIILIKPDEYVKQASPNAELGKTFNVLDINKMSVGMLNHGDMFWNSYDRTAVEVPKGSCKSSLLAGALWIGGLDQGNNLHMAAQTYRQGGNDYYPGPLDTVTLQGSTDPNNPYNRIWKISRREIIAFQQAYADGFVTSAAYTPSNDFVEWPAVGNGNHSRKLAPFVDANGDGVYNYWDGDYPLIKGDQMLFWIFNDNSTIHAETGGTPFGIEVHASAYAFNCNNIADGDAEEVLNYSTFYHYKIINRSDENYSNMYYGKWLDPDLGNFEDDRVGCNPAGNYMFAYNGDNNDEGPRGYGENPPMINVLWLNDTMENFIYYENDFSIIGNPTVPDHYYGYLNSIWKDGSPVTMGGNGYQSGAPDDFMFSGNPYDSTQWNEVSASMPKGDRRMLSSVQDDVLEAGGIKELEYAVIFTRQPNAPNGTNTSWAKNNSDINKIKHWYTTQTFPVCDGVGSSIGPELQNADKMKVYPNPGQHSFNLQIPGGIAEGAYLQVMDITGRIVYEAPVDGSVNTAGWASGAYFIRVQSGAEFYSAKWMKHD